MYNVRTMIEIFSYINRQSDRLISTIASCVVDKTLPTRPEIILSDFRGHISQFRMQTHGREGLSLSMQLCNYVRERFSRREGERLSRNCRGKINAEYSCADEAERECARCDFTCHAIEISFFLFFFSQQGPAYKKHLTYHP